MKPKVQNVDTYYSLDITTNKKELIYCVDYYLRNHKSGSYPNVKIVIQPNDVFNDSMKINYKVGDLTTLESTTNGTIYHVFRSEFKRILENCVIIKGVVQHCQWAVRGHGGMSSLTYIP